MKFYDKKTIENATKDISSFIKSIEEGFKLYSQGKVITPPVGHMHFDNPPGNLHIKYGHIPGEEFFVVKIASHFPENRKKELNSINGTVLLFSQKTGKPIAFFEDEGYLTHLRTGIAGAICAKLFAPKNITSIGIIGSGTQSRFQLRCLETVLPCRKVKIWARNEKEIENFIADPQLKNFDISVAKDINDLMKSCNYIITTTPSHSPLLFVNQLKAGVHITAVGSDSPGKQELDPKILDKADLLVVDSRVQCRAYGETSHLISQRPIYEIGEVLAGVFPKRTFDNQITVADLTGLAIQDLKMVESIFQLPFIEDLDFAKEG